MKISFETYKRLAKKGSPQVYFDAIYRFVSHYVTYAFLRMGATPNHLTFLSITLGILGGAVLAFGKPILGLSIFAVSYLFDFCDGNAARAVIKTVGMDDISKKRGMLFENMNTNIALFSMYLGLGVYFSLAEGSLVYMLLAFLVFGIKLNSRFLIGAEYDMFKEYLSSPKLGKEMMDRYQSSATVKIKFFLSKCLFSANFYYAVYLIGFLFFPTYVLALFVGYSIADMLISILRAMRALTRTYKT